jgi:hypothetical protein
LQRLLAVHADVDEKDADGYSRVSLRCTLHASTLSTTSRAAQPSTVRHGSGAPRKRIRTLCAAAIGRSMKPLSTGTCRWSSCCSRMEPTCTPRPCLGARYRAWGWQQPESGARCRWTPLHSAVHGGHVPATELLLSHGADVQAKTELGCGL